MRPQDYSLTKATRVNGLAFSVWGGMFGVCSGHLTLWSHDDVPRLTGSPMQGKHHVAAVADLTRGFA